MPKKVVDSYRENLRKSLNIEDDEFVPYKISKFNTDYLWYGFMSLVVVLYVGFNLLFSVARVSGVSMDPTLKHNQFIILNKHEKVNRFDIAVFKERLIDGGDTKTIVKRVIGMPGDVVTVVNGELYINNIKYEETYLDAENIEMFKTVHFTIIVPEDHYFVMGDNRDSSKDSRAVGSFIKTSVVGVKI